MPWIPAAIAGGSALLGIIDNNWGSGAKARDQQQQALDQQQALADAQLPDIQRRTELNQWLQDMLQNQYASPNIPSEFLDLDPVFQQFYPDKHLLDNDMFSRISPGIQRKQAFDQLMGLGGNVGTGGIHSQAQLATGIGESRRAEYSQNISDLVATLLRSGILDRQQGVDSAGGYGGYGSGSYLSPNFGQPESGDGSMLLGY